MTLISFAVALILFGGALAVNSNTNIPMHERVVVDRQIHTSTRQQLMSGDHQAEKPPEIGGGDFMPVLNVFP